MRQVTLASGITTSALGFGCASLGSRIAPSDGLSALARAYEHGVSWFDLAPAYGAGRAESIFSEFLKGRQKAVRICTKVGLTSPPQSKLRRILTPALRGAVAQWPALRKTIRRSGITSNKKLPITADLITASIEESLKTLGTEHLHAVALHRADWEDLRRDDVLKTIENMRTSGKVGVFGVAGGAEALRLATQIPGIDFLQYAVARGETYNPRANPVRKDVILHSVFGSGEQLVRWSRILSGNHDLLVKATKQGLPSEPASAAAQLLLARAFTQNPEGICLVSMFSRRSLESALSASRRDPRDDGITALIMQILAVDRGPGTRDHSCD